MAYALTEPFEANTDIYCVYMTNQHVEVTSIPAMLIRHTDGTVYYRLNKPYYITPLHSTYMLELQHFDKELPLKRSVVVYKRTESEAMEYANDFIKNCISQKQSEMESLREDIQRLKALNVY